MSIIHKPDDKLPHTEELLSLGVVTEEDIEEAIAQWKENLLDEEFVEVLEAEEG